MSCLHVHTAPVEPLTHFSRMYRRSYNGAKYTDMQTHTSTHPNGEGSLLSGASPFLRRTDVGCFTSRMVTLKQVCGKSVII